MGSIPERFLVIVIMITRIVSVNKRQGAEPAKIKGTGLGDWETEFSHWPLADGPADGWALLNVVGKTLARVGGLLHGGCGGPFGCHVARGRGEAGREEVRVENP